MVNLDIETGTLEILMTNNVPVGGFQIEFFGMDINGIDNLPSGMIGDYNQNTNMIIVFSLIEADIEPGSEIVALISFSNYNPQNDDICFGNNIWNNIISDHFGNPLETEWGNCICSYDNPVDACGECGGNGILDECNVCNGPGAIYECGCEEIFDGKCDCEGNVEDCLGECGGTAIYDECGICGGDGSSCNNDCESGLCIEPSLISATMDVGDTLTQIITLKNNSEDTLTFQIEINDENNRGEYQVGDVISEEDQNKDFEICYGNPDFNSFNFRNYNGALNGGDYHVFFIEMMGTA